MQPSDLAPRAEANERFQMKLVVALLIVLAAPRAAHADRCVAGTTRPFAICFDPGNRLTLDMAVSAVDGARPVGALGGGLALRHIVHTDDPEVTWRVEHAFLTGAIDLVPTGRYHVTLYDARYLRHARGGHIVIPTSPPHKIWTPFDLGFETTVLSLDGTRDADTARLGMVRAAIVVDLLRSADFTRRLELGPAVRWDVVLSRPRREIDEHLVAPFSVGEATLHLESRDGLSVIGAGAQAGVIWSNKVGWRPIFAARAGVERVVFALNDRPFSLYAEAAWTEPQDGGVSATIGLRLAVFGRRRTDPRR